VSIDGRSMCPDTGMCVHSTSDHSLNAAVLTGAKLSAGVEELQFDFDSAMLAILWLSS
jgi:hypothetical protein